MKTQLDWKDGAAGCGVGTEPFCQAPGQEASFLPSPKRRGMRTSRQRALVPPASWPLANISAVTSQLTPRTFPTRQWGGDPVKMRLPASHS